MSERAPHGVSFATCSFPEYRPELHLRGTLEGRPHIPVRSSNGNPRYKLQYEPFSAKLLPVMGTTFPQWSWVQAAHNNTMSKQQFFARYQAMVTDRVDKIRAEAKKVRAAAGAGTDTVLVLLCFCRLDRPGEWCHRSAFAAAWCELTGEEVPELGRVRMTEIPAQEGLF